MSNSGEAHPGALEKSLGMVSGVVAHDLELCRQDTPAQRFQLGVRLSCLLDLHIVSRERKVVVGVLGGGGVGRKGCLFLQYLLKKN